MPIWHVWTNSAGLGVEPHFGGRRHEVRDWVDDNYGGNKTFNRFVHGNQMHLQTIQGGTAVLESEEPFLDPLFKVNANGAHIGFVHRKGGTCRILQLFNTTHKTGLRSLFLLKNVNQKLTIENIEKKNYSIVSLASHR